MTSRKKNTITLIILSVVLLICLLLYFLMPDRKKEEADGDKDNGQITVDTIAADTIETISFEKDGKTVWSLKRSKENWKMAEDDSIPVNQISLDGYICKPPVYRKTPLGREIADLLLAVNRPYGKSDYIPCICWGRNARFASGFEVGEHVQVLGRIQSRDYVKKLSETETETRTAYEVSVSKLECIEE